MRLLGVVELAGFGRTTAKPIGQFVADQLVIEPRFETVPPVTAETIREQPTSDRSVSLVAHEADRAAGGSDGDARDHRSSPGIMSQRGWRG